MKIAVIGSCQAKGLALALASRLDESCVIEGIERVDVRSNEKKTNDIVDRIKSYDFILSHPTFRPEDGPLRPNDLKTLGPQFIHVPSLYFTGFHPDIVYISRNETAFLASPHSDYHSALIAGAFLAGIPKERVEGLFNNFVFVSLGYFDEFDRAVEDFDRLWSSLEQGRKGVALQLIDEAGAFMHTVNHPHIRVLDHIARAIVDHYIPHLRRIPKAALHDALAQVSLWPIYPGIANRLGVEGDYVFRRPVLTGIQFTLNEMIDRSYEIYERNFEVVRANRRVADTAEKLKEMLVRDKSLQLRPAEEISQMEYIKSDEVRTAMVDALYRSILERAPDESGRVAALEHLSGDLNSKCFTRAMNIFINSKEGAPKLMKRAKSLIEERERAPR